MKRPKYLMLKNPTKKEYKKIKNFFKKDFTDNLFLLKNNIEDKKQLSFDKGMAIGVFNKIYVTALDSYINPDCEIEIVDFNTFFDIAKKQKLTT